MSKGKTKIINVAESISQEVKDKLISCFVGWLQKPWKDWDWEECSYDMARILGHENESKGGWKLGADLLRAAFKQNTLWNDQELEKAISIFLNGLVAGTTTDQARADIWVEKNKKKIIREQNNIDRLAGIRHYIK